MARRVVFCLTAAVAIGVTPVAFGQNTPITSFTPGDLVVMRGGDATYSQSTYSNGEVPTYLDEYTPAGTYVGSYAIPTSVMTLPGIGTDSHEGHLNVSGNGNFINFTGYQVPVDPNNARLDDGSGTARTTK